MRSFQVYCDVVIVRLIEKSNSDSSIRSLAFSFLVPFLLPPIIPSSLMYVPLISYTAFDLII